MTSLTLRARLGALAVAAGSALLAGALAAPTAAAAHAAPEATASAQLPAAPLADITLDSSQAPDLADWLQNEVAPAVHEWYPKIPPELGGTAPTAFSITIDASYTGVAYASGRRIVLGARYFRGHRSDVGAVVHEAVHIAQQYRRLSGWAVEGVADWFRFYKYAGTGVRKPSRSSSWTAGYRTTAYYFEYIRANHDPEFLRKMHAAGKAGTPSADAVIQGSTGMTPQQVWDEMQNA